MVAEIVALAQVAAETGRPVLGERVLAAMRKVPRHEFVPRDQKRAAYRNRPLPIGEGQTISQPDIVALMTDLLELEPDAKVLEIGTGCGYQSAVLAEVAGKVHSIEIIDRLGSDKPPQRWRGSAMPTSRRASAMATRDGRDAAPFDAIIVTAAPDHTRRADPATEALRTSRHPGRDAGARADGGAQERRRHHAQRADRAGAFRAADARDGIAPTRGITSTFM